VACCHPYDPDVAVRIICWFPANDQTVLALVGVSVTEDDRSTIPAELAAFHFDHCEGPPAAEPPLTVIAQA
jgi:hypothetical protein